MVNMLPSILPVEKPCQVCAAYSGGCGRPSIQMVRSGACQEICVCHAIGLLRGRVHFLPDAEYWPGRACRSRTDAACIGVPAASAAKRPSCRRACARQQ